MSACCVRGPFVSGSFLGPTSEPARQTRRALAVKRRTFCISPLAGARDRQSNVQGPALGRLRRRPVFQLHRRRWSTVTNSRLQAAPSCQTCGVSSQLPLRSNKLVDGTKRPLSSRVEPQESERAVALPVGASAARLCSLSFRSLLIGIASCKPANVSLVRG